MKRCYQTTDKEYHRYGGRGIAVCDEWKTFTNFLKDMGKRSPGFTLERINTNLGYEPGNCRWASRLEQARNRRNNSVYTVNGITGCLTELAGKFKIPAGIVSNRIRMGIDPEEAFNRPVAKHLDDRKRALIVSLSKISSQTEIAATLGIHQTTVSRVVRSSYHAIS